MNNFTFLSYARIVMNLLGFYFDFNNKFSKKITPENYRGHTVRVEIASLTFRIAKAIY